jgi:GNAT superfamily N-acetyltransferase
VAESLHVGCVVTLPVDVDELVTASVSEDFRALQRLRTEWDQGTNRFSDHGEALFEARLGPRLVAICGLNRDPYTDRQDVGRLRHLYVSPDCRRKGVGRALVAAILQHAGSNFQLVRLRTDRTDADQF